VSGILINGVWIVSKEKGVCIFHHRFHGKEINPDLFSGFLSGIFAFSEEITETGGIEVMDLKDIRILYCIIANLIFIMAITKDEDVDYLREKISEISEAFVSKYGKVLEKWEGEITIFDPFKQDLNLLIEKMRPVNFVEVAYKLPQKKRLKLADEEIKVLSLCDGKTPVEVIANRTKIPEIILNRILNKLEKKKIIKRKMIMRT
jgi:hypothetical protein